MSKIISPDRRFIPPEESMALDGSRTYIPIPFVHTIFPHRNPKSDTWIKESEKFKLRVISGYYDDDSIIGIPFGPKTRLIICAMASEVGRTEKPQIYLGDSMNKFLERLGIPHKGGGPKSDRAAVAEQMCRLLNCFISVYNKKKPEESIVNEQSKKKRKLPARNLVIASHDNTQSVDSWEKTITLGPDFFDILMRYDKVPLDTAHLKVFKSSSLQLDLYAWLTWRSFKVMVTKDTGPFHSWAELRLMFSAYKYDSDFKKVALPPLREIEKIYKGLSIVVDDDLGIGFKKDTLPAIEPKMELIED